MLVRTGFFGLLTDLVAPLVCKCSLDLIILIIFIQYKLWKTNVLLITMYNNFFKCRCGGDNLGCGGDKGFWSITLLRDDKIR